MLPPETPRLSETLTGPKSPDRCQSCGAEGWPETGVPGYPPLVRWVECDEADKPTRTVVVLCKACSDRLIEKHPRLYIELAHDRPYPGVMGLCVECSHRVGVSCPVAKWSGGPGLVITIPKPSQVHLCRSPRRLSGWVTLWRGPAKACDQRKPIEQEVTSAQAQA